MKAVKWFDGVVADDEAVVEPTQGADFSEDLVIANVAKLDLLDYDVQ